MILVVDDDKNIRLSLKLILERNEYVVALAEGPKEAVWNVTRLLLMSGGSGMQDIKPVLTRSRRPFLNLPMPTIVLDAG